MPGQSRPQDDSDRSGEAYCTVCDRGSGNEKSSGISQDLSDEKFPRANGKYGKQVIETSYSIKYIIILASAQLPLSYFASSCTRPQS